MNKPTLLFRGPVKTRSGYGAHSRDLLESLYTMDLFDIRIDSCMWGNTPMTALEDDNLFHKWIESNIVTEFQGLPDVYIQVTVPNEFQRFGKLNIGITAGIETTLAPKDWIDGCNRMDLIITTSNFSKDVLVNTSYSEIDNKTNLVTKQHKIEKPIEVLFEGVDTSIYNNQTDNKFLLDIKEDFAFLFVGHWLKGNIGHDRKDIGMLIRCFVEAFKNEKNKPALVLKTSSANFSVLERENFRKKIEDCVGDIKNPPSIYLLFGELSNEEMNSLYNHPKIKSMISITKGEGFGRPMLEFTMTGKPVIASNWSGHKDFLPLDKSYLIGGKLIDVDESSQDTFIIKGSKWFTANYGEVVGVMKLMVEDYVQMKIKSESLREENVKNFSLEKMTEEFKKIIQKRMVIPSYTNLVLPSLFKL